MKYKDLTKEDKLDFMTRWNQSNPTNRKDIREEFFNIYGIKTRTIYSWIRKIDDENSMEANTKINKPIVNEVEEILETPKLSIITPEQKKLHKLTVENRELKKAMREAKVHISHSDDIKSLIASVEKVGFDTIPKWINNKSSNTDKLVPVLFITDTHIGEVIDAEDMGFTESYNTEIAINSINRVTEDFIDICKNKMTNYEYDGVVLMLGGDMITGNLHDLSETNDSTPIEQVISATSVFIQQIEKLKENFRKVVVMECGGNHPRYDPTNYTKTKNRTANSLETLIYHYIAEHFKDDNDIVTVYDKSDEVLFSINGRRFLLTHGDRGFKGGNGIGGITVPIKKSRTKMLKSMTAIGREFDTLVLGHFHQHHISDDLIIGASTKPYDEYCKSMGFEYNTAGATSFFVNTHGDIIFGTKLQIRDENKVTNDNKKSIELF